MKQTGTELFKDVFEAQPGGCDRSNHGEKKSQFSEETAVIWCMSMPKLKLLTLERTENTTGHM